MREPSDRRKRTLLARPSVRGVANRYGGYLYRKGELLVMAGGSADVRAQLTQVDLPAERVEAIEDPGAGRPGVLRVRHRLDDEEEVAAHDRIRRATAGASQARQVRITPNHLLTAQPIYMGGGESEPVPATGLGPRQPPPATRSVVVAVADTLEVRHPWLEGAYRQPVRHVSVEHHRAASDEAHGHGTFVAGIVIQQAPAAHLAVVGVLDDDGVGDDFTVALGLRELGDGIDIINLSLGGYTFDDMPPVALDAELAALSPSTVVVCAAGNNDEARPFWPAAAAAATANVIAVGAVDAYGGKAPFSNYGDWVSACAVGTDVLSTYPTFHEEVDGRWEDFEGWATWDGTSFAAPFVAGKIAAAMAASGADAPDAARSVLAAGTVVTGLGRRIT